MWNHQNNCAVAQSVCINRDPRIAAAMAKSSSTTAAAATATPSPPSTPPQNSYSPMDHECFYRTVYGDSVPEIVPEWCQYIRSLDLSTLLRVKCVLQKLVASQQTQEAQNLRNNNRDPRIADAAAMKNREELFPPDSRCWYTTRNGVPEYSENLHEWNQYIKSLDSSALLCLKSDLQNILDKKVIM